MSFLLRSIAEKKETDMLQNVKSLVEFIEAFRASPIYDSSSTAKSSFREDIGRMLLIAASISKAGLQLSELEDLEFAKSALVKNKTGVFYQGMSLFPTGTFIIERLQKKVMQCRQDQLHQKELSTVGEFALGFGNITKDTIIKKTGDGDFEVVVPSAGKIADMLVKLNSFVEGASAELQSTEASVSHMTEIKLRFSELKSALEEALVLKYNQRLQALNEMFKKMPMGLTDEQTAECVQELQRWQIFQPAPKVQLLKLLGKEVATEIEGYMASLTSISKLLQAALPKLAKLPQTSDDSAKQSLLMNDMMTNLVASLHNKDAINAVEKLAPILKEGLCEVKKLISSAVAAWASRMASTFDTFLGSLMSPEIIVESVLKAEVTGTLGQEGDEGIDWSGIYAGFIHFEQDTKVKIEVDMGGSKKPMEVHVAFLCLAGALLQVAKFAFAMVQLSGDTSKKLCFAELYQKEQAEKKSLIRRLMGSLLSFLIYPVLLQLSSAMRTSLGRLRIRSATWTTLRILPKS